MGSFSKPHYMYIFEMKNGKQKLAYGHTPEEALNILAIRLSDEEMALIHRDQFKKISQRRLQQYIGNLG
ncbi:MAG: hypothetical protein AAGD96_26250 [Chloroflexota bacterium]